MAKILLVGDSQPDRDTLARRFEGKGFAVLTAPDAQRGVDLARADSPDLILMELNVSACLDGWGATGRLRQSVGGSARAVPVIALGTHAADAAGATDAARARALQAGCDDYDTRPVDFPRLLAKVEALLNRSVTGVTGVTAAGSAADTLPTSDVSRAAGHVLVVDDAEDGRDVLARLLKLSGFTVETAEDGRHALEMTARRPYDAVLLDVMMPGIDGIEVLRALRRDRGLAPTDLPVIMVTAVGESQQIVAALAAGANDYVTKPLDLPVVLARVRTQMSLKRAVEQIRELERGLEQRNRELQTANLRMRNDLEAAAKVQASLLPARSPDVPGYRFAWLFRPSAALAGDILNVFPLDPEHVGLYVLDVAGHGVASALLSVTVSRFLSPAPDSSSILWRRVDGGEYSLEPPARVAERLSQRFPFDSVTCQFFTLLYGALDPKAHRLRYISAGHPNIVHLRHGGGGDVLPACGYPIGVGGGKYDEFDVDIAPGDRLYVHSDGITDAMSATGQLFGSERMMAALEEARHLPLEAGLELLSDRIDAWSGAGAAQDDQTMLAIERVLG